MLRDTLISEMDKLLAVRDFSDYCHNGLQVEGKEKISHMVSAVSASKELIDKAISLKADAILVHHGIFWQGDELKIIGMNYRRVKPLIENEINLIAYHLPLDAHPKLGNNAELARILKLKTKGSFADIGSKPYAFYGKVKEPMPPVEFTARIEKALNRAPIHISGGKKLIKNIAWCSGAAQDLIEDAARLKVDAYLSGEISEHTVHKARELGLDYFAIGHHASERYGVKALGDYLQTKYSISHTYIELDNPV